MLKDIVKSSTEETKWHTKNICLAQNKAVKGIKEMGIWVV